MALPCRSGYKARVQLRDCALRYCRLHTSQACNPRERGLTKSPASLRTRFHPAGLLSAGKVLRHVVANMYGATNRKLHTNAINRWSKESRSCPAEKSHDVPQVSKSMSAPTAPNRPSCNCQDASGNVKHGESSTGMRK